MDFFDYDPLTGVTDYFDMDPEGKIHITSKQDVKPLLDHNAALRNEGIKDGPDKKGHAMMRHYASVPQIVIMEMLNKGIDFFAKDDFPKVIAEINANYPYLKVTNKNYAVK